MTPKFRTNLMALAVALGTLVAGYGLGEPPSHPVDPAIPAAELGALEGDDMGLEAAAAERARLGRVALKRHVAMPYVSMAALMPRQES